MKNSEIYRFHNRTLVIADEAMTKTIEWANRAAKSHLPVLLVGESGTGKELVARYIHERGNRSKSPFVSVNCAAIPDGLMEAELFGFERGAFTGALSQRIGKFERANGGTLLLDEISEMSWALQAKLLRALQEGEIDRLGGREPIAVNTRIMATTNIDPMLLINQGKFREDLYYRLNVIRIDCPALQMRTDAIDVLTNTFIQQACDEQGHHQVTLSSQAIDKLRSHRWPGNVRELRNVVERAVLMCDGDTLLPEHFSLGERREESNQNGPTDKLSDLEQQHILSVLETKQGNRTEAARSLGISVRTLRNKLKLYTA